jgi:repressor LexA
VKQLRKEKGMTQEELATKLGYKSKSSVTHIENGRDIPRSMVVQLADILETTPSFLMGWSEQKENAPIINDRSAVIERINSLSDEQFEKLHDKLEGYLDGLMEE